MSLKRISRKAFLTFLDTAAKTEKVIGVQAKGDRFDFGPLTSSRDLRLDYDVTLQPPKKYFQPPVETLMTYQIGRGYQSQCQDEKFVLIGVHPYDMVAINQIDKLFSQDNCDIHYVKRRQNATIIASDVITPSKDVFASSMGTAVVTEGYDALLTDIGDCYVVDVATHKAEQFFANAKEMTDANADDLDKRQQVWDKNKKQLSKHQLKCSCTYLPRLLSKAYEHPVWEEKAKICFSCGSCNQVCPTCYCFNVHDDINWDMKTGRRDRSWDGCLLDGFAKVAGNHDFRKSRADRFRHRLYRKAKYVPAKIGGQIACVGCGRCVGACLPNIANPIAVYNRLVDDLGIE
jgi:ferredoxin